MFHFDERGRPSSIIILPSCVGLDYDENSIHSILSSLFIAATNLPVVVLEERERARHEK